MCVPCPEIVVAVVVVLGLVPRKTRGVSIVDCLMIMKVIILEKFFFFNFGFWLYIFEFFSF